MGLFAVAAVAAASYVAPSQVVAPGARLRIRPSVPTALRHAPPAFVATHAPVATDPTRAHWLTYAIRSAHVGAIGAAFAFPGTVNAAVAGVWHAYSSFALTRHPMFEASWAVTVFIVTITFFESLHLWRPGVLAHRLDGAPPKQPLRYLRDHWHKAAVPAATYLASIYAWHKLRLGRILFGVPPGGFVMGAPTFARVAVELTLGVFLYDLVFYPFHLAFHRLRLPAWRRLHNRHHRWAASEGGGAAHNAVETVQNTYVDAGVQVFINICVQQVSFWGRKHPLSRFLHNFMVPYLLTEAHSGYNLPFMSHRLWPAVLGGAPRHEEHHRRGGVYFHQYFKYLDDAFGHTPEARARRAARQRERRAARHDDTTGGGVGASEAAREDDKALTRKLDAALPLQVAPPKLARHPARTSALKREGKASALPLGANDDVSKESVHE